MVHLPVHASWLNQIEIYFSILTRKAEPTSTPASHSATTPHNLRRINEVTVSALSILQANGP
jgi:hypothetical protein